MKLLTKELENQLPALYSTEEIPAKEVVVVARFFHPNTDWQWLVVEGSWVDEDGMRDGDKPKTADYLFFGRVDGFEREWGYFSLNELQENGVQRDPDFRPRKVKEL